MRRVRLPPLPSMVRCALLAVGASGALIVSAPVAAQVGQYPLDSPTGLHLHNVTAEAAVLQGKKGLRVTISAEAERRFQAMTAEEQARFEQLGIIDGLQFANGVIEAEIAGAPAPGAPEGARGFVGIAFRLQDDLKTYDAFYLRPTNGRTDDQERRNHAVQYISHPDWPWFRLRKEFPSRYESYVDLLPDVWTRVKSKYAASARVSVCTVGGLLLSRQDLDATSLAETIAAASAFATRAVLAVSLSKMASRARTRRNATMDRNGFPVTPVDARVDELRALLAAIIDSSDDAIVSKTLDGVITSWNQGAERLFGYTATEAIGQPIFLIVPEDRKAEEHNVLARLRRGERIDHFETVRRCKDGREVHISLTVSPIKDAAGTVIGASKIARDISDRRLAHELRARLAAIVDSSYDAIISKTLDGTITSWNRGAERLFGYTATEAVGQHIFLIIPEDRKSEELDVLALLRHGEKVDHFETVRQTKDGRRLHVSLTVSPVKDAQGTVIGASKVARDISEHILAEEALRRAHEELEERIRDRTAELVTANEALRVEMARRQQVEQERMKLLARVVLAEEDERRRIARELHDQLGQQLTALRLTLEMLKASSVQRTELRVQVEMLEELALQLDREVAFRVCELRPTELETLGLETALTNYVRNWSKHFGIPVQLHTTRSADDGLTSELKTTTYRLAQESLNNIVKHARAGRVDVALECNSAYLSLIIEDDGIGFDSSRVEAAGKGFGLIGMRERAALVGAQFQVESTPGRGTTVILRASIATPIKT